MSGLTGPIDPLGADVWTLSSYPRFGATLFGSSHVAAADLSERSEA